MKRRQSQRMVVTSTSMRISKNFISSLPAMICINGSLGVKELNWTFLCIFNFITWLHRPGVDLAAALFPFAFDLVYHEALGMMD